ncbi:hypothetical protein P4U57_20065 [Bacillus pseudomycoides]|nr:MULTISPECIES: hypothetical protein [Bacillus]MED1476602.1 hypothetical protein [Bacillus pseudomycoides]
MCIYRKEERGWGNEFITYFIGCTVYFISHYRYNLLIEEKMRKGLSFLTLHEI